MGRVRKDAGAVELARLESVYGGNLIMGSNPIPSANNNLKALTYEQP
jgi:hypothetical protein